MINLTQNQLLDILEEFYKKGNISNEVRTKDMVEEMKQYILNICDRNSFETK